MYAKDLQLFFFHPHVSLSCDVLMLNTFCVFHCRGLLANYFVAGFGCGNFHHVTVGLSDCEPILWRKKFDMFRLWHSVCT